MSDEIAKRGPVRRLWATQDQPICFQNGCADQCGAGVHAHFFFISPDRPEGSCMPRGMPGKPPP